jgi:hypothetical protein
MSYGWFLSTALLQGLNEGLDDEDKWFYFTGGFPTDPIKKLQFDTNGWKQNTLVLFGFRFQLDRGASNFYLPIAYAAKMAVDISRGKDLGDDIMGLTSSILPSTFQIGELVESWERNSFKVDSDEEGVRPINATAQKAAIKTLQNALPYRGLVATFFRKNQDPIDRRNKITALQELLSPYTLSNGDDEFFERHNVLGQKVYLQDNRVTTWMASLGIPISHRAVDRNSDMDRQNREVYKVLLEIGKGSVPMTHAKVTDMAKSMDKTFTNEQFNNRMAKTSGDKFGKLILENKGRLMDLNVPSETRSADALHSAKGALLNKLKKQAWRETLAEM